MGIHNQLFLLKKKDPSVTRLFEDILSTGSTLRVKVTGRSMAPFLSGGEIVTIKSVPCALLHRGDLIFFINGEYLPILHRIIHKKKNRMERLHFLPKGMPYVLMTIRFPVGRF